MIFTSCLYPTANAAGGAAEAPCELKSAFLAFAAGGGGVVTRYVGRGFAPLLTQPISVKPFTLARQETPG